jgi:hypothetical protein
MGSSYTADLLDFDHAAGSAAASRVGAAKNQKIPSGRSAKETPGGYFS